MSLHARRILLLSAALLAGLPAAGEDRPEMETVVLSPLQVLAKSLEMVAHTSTHQGKRSLDYIRGKNVAQGSRADRAGLKAGDRIVAIEGWRLEGQEPAALNREFRTKLRDGEPTLTLAVRHSYRDKEHEVTLTFPATKPPPREPIPSPES